MKDVYNPMWLDLVVGRNILSAGQLFDRIRYLDISLAFLWWTYHILSLSQLVHTSIISIMQSTKHVEIIIVQI